MATKAKSTYGSGTKPTLNQGNNKPSNKTITHEVLESAQASTVRPIPPSTPLLSSLSVPFLSPLSTETTTAAIVATNTCKKDGAPFSLPQSKSTTKNRNIGNTIIIDLVDPPQSPLPLPLLTQKQLAKTPTFLPENRKTEPQENGKELPSCRVLDVYKVPINMIVQYAFSLERLNATNEENKAATAKNKKRRHNSEESPGRASPNISIADDHADISIDASQKGMEINRDSILDLSKELGDNQQKKVKRLLNTSEATATAKMTTTTTTTTTITPKQRNVSIKEHKITAGRQNSKTSEHFVEPNQQHCSLKRKDQRKRGDRFQIDQTPKEDPKGSPPLLLKQYDNFNGNIKPEVVDTTRQKHQQQIVATTAIGANGGKLVRCEVSSFKEIQRQSRGSDREVSIAKHQLHTKYPEYHHRDKYHETNAGGQIISTKIAAIAANVAAEVVLKEFQERTKKKRGRKKQVR